MRKPNERGAVSVLIILLVVLVVAAVGVAIKNSQTKVSHDKITSERQFPPPSVTPTPTPTPRPSVAPTPTIPVSTGSVDSAGYMTIKEYGVRFKAGSDLEGLKYSYGGSGGSYARFSSSSVNCGVGALGTLGQSTDDPATFASGGPYTVIKKIGSNYYFHTSPQNYCSYGDAAEAEQKDEIESLIAELRSLEPAN